MRQSIVRKNLLFSLGFGLIMGIIFPLYASFFVTFKSRPLFFAFSAGCLAAGFIVGLSAYLISKVTIIRTVGLISGQLKALSTEDGNTGTRVELQSDDVVGELAAGFNAALDRFRGNSRLLGKTAGEAIVVSNTVKDLVGKSVGSIEEILKTAETMGSAVNSQEAVIGEMDGYFSLLNKSILLNASSIIELYSNLTDFSKILASQTESIEAILDEISRISDGIGAGKDSRSGEAETLLSAANRFGSGAEETVIASLNIFKSVRAAMNDIENISDRTNVLSINASIEAARLGSSAQGFRVIAGNIKNLAGEVQTLTALIEGLLERGESQLQSAADKTRMAMKDHEGMVVRINESIGQVSVRQNDIHLVTNRLRDSQSMSQNLLGDIKENMGDLKNRVKETRTVLNRVIDSAAVIKDGIGSLYARTGEMRKAEDQARAALTGFRDHLAPLEKAAAAAEEQS